MSDINEILDARFAAPSRPCADEMHAAIMGRSPFVDLVLLTAEVQNPAFDSVNPMFKSGYTSLAGGLDTLRKAAAKNYFGFMQDVTVVRGADGIAEVHVTSHLVHASGRYFTNGPVIIRPVKQDPHGIVGAATYARRVGAFSLFGVAGDSDDDGNTAVGRPEQKAQPKPGIGVHSPLGDVAPDDASIAYADAFREAIASGDATKVQQVHADLHGEGEEAYRNAWSLLDSKTRSAIKKVLSQKEAA